MRNVYSSIICQFNSKFHPLFAYNILIRTIHIHVWYTYILINQASNEGLLSCSPRYESIYMYA